MNNKPILFALTIMFFCFQISAMDKDDRLSIAELQTFMRTHKCAQQQACLITNLTIQTEQMTDQQYKELNAHKEKFNTLLSEHTPNMHKRINAFAQGDVSRFYQKERFPLAICAMLYGAVKKHDDDGVVAILNNCSEVLMPHAPNTGKSMMYVACEDGSIPLAEFCIKQNANINLVRFTDDSKTHHYDASTPLARVCYEKKPNVKMVELLLSGGADPCRGDDSNYSRKQSAFSVACREFCSNSIPEFLKIVKLMLSTKKIKVLFLNRELHYACEYSCPALVEILLEQGADPNDCESEVEAESYYYDSVPQDGVYGKDKKYPLAESGTHWYGCTPLHRASRQGNVEIVEMLLNMGADCNSIGKEFWWGKRNWPPMYYASRPVIISLLLKAGAKLSVDGQKWTPLHVAARYNNLQALEMLYKAGSDIDAADSEGKTSLHHAAIWNYPIVAETLLQLGANPSPLDWCGETPLDCSRDDCLRDRSMVREILSRYGANTWYSLWLKKVAKVVLASGVFIAIGSYVVNKLTAA